jgi:hypothetical protein
MSHALVLAVALSLVWAVSDPDEIGERLTWWLVGVLTACLWAML